MKRVTIIYILLISLFACNHQEYSNVDNKYILNLNDSIIYKSKSTNIVDTFIVFTVKNGYNVIDGYYNEEYYEIDFRKINSQCTDCDDFGIYRISEYFMLYTQNRNFSNTNYYKSLDPVKYRLDSKTINNVYVIEDSSKTINETDIVTMYYCDIYGVIRYDQKNGEVFELQLNN